MNKKQARLLIEVEYYFYRAGTDEDSFSRVLVGLGYKPNPDLTKLTDEALKRLNLKLRKVLRSSTVL